jgi:hypothetical protein
MTEFFTASWSALHEAASANIWAPLEVFPVRISRDAPKFWRRAQSFPAIEELAPDRWIMSIKDPDRAGQAYRRKLEEVGIEQIQRQLDHLRDSYERPLVLANFESDPHHRDRGPSYSFEGWYEEQTGIEVPRWEPHIARVQLSQSDLSGELRLVWDRVAALREGHGGQDGLGSSAAPAPA